MKKSIQLVALLLTVVMGSCTGGKDKAATEHVVEKPKVKVADVKARPVDQIQEYTATVEAEAKNNIAPSSPVRIDQIFVEVGDRVSKGQKLVQMDAANLKQIDNESGEIPVTVTLKGRWKVVETPYCKVVSEDKKQTVLRFLCKDGASYEVELEK